MVIQALDYFSSAFCFIEERDMLDKTNKAAREIKSHRDKITFQQYRTLMGQLKHGDVDAAIKGLNKILKRGTGNEKCRKNCNA